MAVPHTLPTPIGIVSVLSDHGQGPSILGHDWGRQAVDQPMRPGLAACDVIDEVRLRMARLGYRWE